MYIAKRNQSNDPEVIRDLIIRYGFATLVSFDGKRPIATHVPLQLFEESGSMVLKGHLAKANPQWKHWDGSEILAIFQGPDAYVSPTWYDHINVPTWNYAAVHAYGKTRIIDDPDELFGLLKNITDRYEASSGGKYSVEGLPEKYYNNEIKALVGFAITVTSVETSLKLSQNRHAQDYATIIGKLSGSTDHNAQEVARLMEKHNPHNNK